MAVYAPMASAVRPMQPYRSLDGSAIPVPLEASASMEQWPHALQGIRARMGGPVSALSIDIAPKESLRRWHAQPMRIHLPGRLPAPAMTDIYPLFCRVLISTRWRLPVI